MGPEPVGVIIVVVVLVGVPTMICVGTIVMGAAAAAAA